jgi:hypothetical protein
MGDEVNTAIVGRVEVLSIQLQNISVSIPTRDENTSPSLIITRQQNVPQFFTRVWQSLNGLPVSATPFEHV